jgi:hypothetical protein
MKRFISACLALASACAAGAVVRAARPQYGGTLRVETDGTIRSLDPASAASGSAETMARRRAAGLVFETLVAAEADGLRPLLATAWESDARGARWRFHLRAGVRQHDGSRLEAWQVATALRASEPAWTIAADGETLLITTVEPVRDLPWTLSDPRHAVVVRASGGALIGTGPFAIERLEPQRLTLRANDQYWGGRPFVDFVQIDMGRSRAVQLADLEGGRADIISATPLDARRLTQRGLHVAASRSVETVALVFEPHRSSDAARPLRRTLSAAVNRSSLCAVLLQGLAEPADALVPRWLSGYAPLFVVDSKGTLSREAIAALPAEQRELSIRVDASDAVVQAITDRIAVDGREAGLGTKVQAPGLAPRPDARVLRIGLPASAPDRALAAVADHFAARDPIAAAAANLPPGAPIDAVYQAEQKWLDRAVVIPIVHLPEVYGLSDRVGTWNAEAVRAAGQWNFADVWLRAGRP